MSLYEERKKEFITTIKKEGNLPKLWAIKFNDGEDQRLWFDKIKSSNQFQDFIIDVSNILSMYGKSIISDIQKEQLFKRITLKIRRIPNKNEFYFEDNEDMFTWYINYIVNNQDYEIEIYKDLPEYNEFDLASIWSDIKKEFAINIKRLKRIPKYGDAKLNETGIDISVIFTKLATFDREYFEKILLHLEGYKKEHLSPDQRKKEFITFITNNKYIPILQEARFSDGCDMFTWYNTYKDKIPDLEDEISTLITKDSPLKKVNIYLIPNFKNNGGKFYTICTNTGELLDLTELTSFEEAKKLDSTLTKKGGLILKKDEEIGTISFKRSKK